MKMVNRERKEKVTKNKDVMMPFHAVEKDSLDSNQERIRKAMAREAFHNFAEGYFTLVGGRL